ncbi:MAG: serine hydrolase [Desulfobacteraceae bacterium]|nr:serine hydrolase [Desulfobacteraceae bacterium]
MPRNKISKAIHEAISKGVFPGAVLLCAENHEIIFHESYGMADISEKKRMQKDSIFDLASLTKPLATTLAMSKLIETQKISSDQTIGSILKEFKHSDKNDITIDMLLRHTSGLPAYREYFRQIVKVTSDSREYLKKKLLVQESLENKMGECQVYSDLGFMILSWIIETVTGQKLDQFVSDQIYSPLGINDLSFFDINSYNNKKKEWGERIVATQKCPWRKKMLIGEVDDDNAWAVGGVDGHAGLFGDAVSVYMVCCEILNAIQGNQTKVLDTNILKAFVQRKKQQDMVAGFDTPSKEKSSSGAYFSSSSIGHLGFTGTSFWIDPKISFIVIFLTNRVHPSRINEGIKEIRPLIHDLVYSELIQRSQNI